MVPPKVVNRMYEHILPLVNSQPLINVTYTTCDKPGTEVDESLNQLNFTKWDISLDPPSNIKNADLMVAKNVLHKQRNLSKALKNMSSAIKDNGFILIEEITSNFPVGFSSEQLWEEPLEIDDDRSCYCFCNEQKWCQIFDENGFDIIFKRSSNNSYDHHQFPMVPPKVVLTKNQLENCLLFLLSR
jgi:hypothetical protein